MLSVIKNKTFWMSLLIGLLGFCSSILLSISDLFRYDWSVVKNVIDTNGSLLMARLISSGVYAFLFSFFSYLIGKKLYKNYQIEQKKITKESKKELILMGIICVIFPFIVFFPLLTDCEVSISSPFTESVKPYFLASVIASFSLRVVVSSDASFTNFFFVNVCDSLGLKKSTSNNGILLENIS